MSDNFFFHREILFCGIISDPELRDPWWQVRQINLSGRYAPGSRKPNDLCLLGQCHYSIGKFKL